MDPQETTLVAFWIGYHRSAAMRGLGAPGMALSMLVLLYVAGRFGFDLAGPAGVVIVVALFASIEAFLFVVTRRTPGAAQQAAAAARHPAARTGGS